MTFPCVLTLGPWRLHAHTLLEMLAYALGLAIYSAQRLRLRDGLDDLTRWRLLAAAAVGAMLGARLLAYAADPGAVADLPLWERPLAVKTILGGLLGGTVAVEWLKRRLGLAQRTGDVYALAIVVAIAIGRLGCFLEGVGDHTAGVPCPWPWCLDQGDGIPRHPAALYEMAACLLIAARLAFAPSPAWRQGDRYRWALLAYAAARFAIEAVKPYPRWGGLTLYQWACLGLLAAWWPDARRLFLPPCEPAHG